MAIKCGRKRTQNAARIIRVKTKEFTYNYVDRVRLAENSQYADHNSKCRSRGFGWRHNRSISHLDLATSCHSAASGLSHWPNSRQLRHSRSLDYNHIDRCKDALEDIAEFYWRIDPEAELYAEDEHATLPSQPTAAAAPPPVDQKSSPSRHNETHCRGYNYGDESAYHNQLQEKLQYQNSTSAPLPHFEYDGEACSLRRSRSLAVIREETFSDLQITSANSSRRRSQLIPRAHLVNRGFFQEREKQICGNNKHEHAHNHRHHHHHHHNNLNHNLQQQNPKEKHSSHSGNEQDKLSTVSGCSSVNGSITCQSHYNHTHHNHHQNQHKSHRDQSACCGSGSVRHQCCETSSTVDYYDNLKRLDAIATGFGEQLHPWHNDKSDLESLNSDYFKNSLHQPQSHELKQHLDIEALEEAVNILNSNDKPRIYQSRRQTPRSHIVERFCSGKQQRRQHKNSIATSSCHHIGVDSCPENSQSSVFPETTTSNSDDQTDDSPSVSEQEYDLTKIEEIFQKNQREGDYDNEVDYNDDDDDEIFELISLTANTRLENTKDEEIDEHPSILKKEGEELISSRDRETHHRLQANPNDDDVDAERSSLKRIKAISENLEKLIAYDSVYLSSEEGSEGTLIEENSSDGIFNDENTSTLLHISIEDIVYEPNDSHEHKIPCEKQQTIDTEKATITSPIYTQVLKVEQSQANGSAITVTAGVTSSAAIKPNILSVVEKRKLKRFSTENSIPIQTSSQNQHHHQHQSSVSSVSSFSPNALKRASNDSSAVCLPPYHLPKENLGNNQYHSLPDVSISQSLKVSECIDAELRSSYKYNRCNCVDAKCQRQQERKTTTAVETKTTTTATTIPTPTILKTSQPARDIAVISEEIYDSIKRFGRAHQKARQREYKELLRNTNSNCESEKDKNKEDDYQEDEIKRFECDNNETSISITCDSIDGKVPPLATLDPISSTHSSPSPWPSTSFSTTPKENAIVNSEYQFSELPKEAPGIEVSNFSKEINEGAKKIHLNSILDSKTSRLSKAIDDDTDEPNQQAFRIIVTDTQNNIIEEDSIDGNRGESTSDELEPRRPKQSPRMQEHLIKRKSSFSSNQIKIIGSANSLRRVSSKTKRPHSQQAQRQSKLNGSEAAGKQNPQHRQAAIESSVKSKEHRVLGAHIYRARPVRVLASTATDSFRRGKMSRPQIMHVVEHKRRQEANEIVDSNRPTAASFESSANTENEYLRKVDAVRYYWSKLAEDGGLSPQPELNERLLASRLQFESKEIFEPKIGQLDNQAKDFSKQPERRHFILGANKQQPQQQQQPTTATASPDDDFCSFMPSIEIVELEGDKKATIVSAVPPNVANSQTNEPQFDHIRYKVLKSQQLLRNNLKPRTKNEAQFDGLIQYLQDYSFQELLSNNNVVIVEPVRTKVELPAVRRTETHQQHQNRPVTSDTKIGDTNTTTTTTPSSCERNSNVSGKVPNNGSNSNGGIRRHFFYQPVRVNREMYEEELPNPDTVRNVRKFFEEHMLLRTGQGLVFRSNDTSTIQNCEAEMSQSMKKSHDLKIRRERKYRYLTIDTSYGHTLRHHHHHHHHIHENEEQQQQRPAVSAPARKWDTASLSSGISSGDLSSPCECNDADTTTTATTTGITNRRSNAHDRPDALPPMAIVHPQEFKEVHVQDVVRRHNNINNNNKNNNNSHSNSKAANTVYEPLGNSTYLRDIYEHHIGQRHYHQAGGGGDDKSAKHTFCFLTDEKDMDDDEQPYDYDDDDDLYDTHYVSNEVLQKIRECGSSVTYYGGRVLEDTSSRTLRVGSPAPNQQNTPNTLTRTRLRQIATCSVCQPHECPQKSQLQDNIRQQQQQPQQQQQEYEQPGAVKDVGIKFKLVKSNSCSSRLELAGAEDDESEPAEQAEETEVVKRMVSRFERNHHQQKSQTDEELSVTINNQTPLPQKDNIISNNNNNGQHVTVNNHINIPQQVTKATAAIIGLKHEKLANDVKSYNNVSQMDSTKTTTTTTIIAAAAKILCGNNVFSDTSKETLAQVDFSNKEGNHNHKNNQHQNGDSKKIIRNKNVDLAFTMARQMQGKSNAACKGAQMTERVTTTATLSAHNGANNVTDATEGKTFSNFLGSTVANRNEIVDNAREAKASATPTASMGKCMKEVKKMNDVREIDSHAARSRVPLKMTKPTQIIVPVQIHCTSESIASSSRASCRCCVEDAPHCICLSSASSSNGSSASLIEKNNVVRHYVANDKSLFEKRKYDDIEFEEFEVYDPSKESHKKRSENISETSSAGKVCSNDNSNVSSIAVNSKSPSSSNIDNLSSIIDEAGEGGTNEDLHSDDNSIINKSKSETDCCYDSLDDKI